MWIVAAVVSVLVAAIAGVLMWVLVDDLPPLTIDGTLTLHDDSHGLHSGHPATWPIVVVQSGGQFTCSGGGGYDDIVPGAAVTVFDEDDTVVATGQLGEGEAEGWGARECTFPFSVSEVPGGSRFYSIEVGRRGQVRVDTRDAVDGRLPVALTIR